MLSVKRVDDGFKEVVKSFLKSVPSVSTIDDNVLNNASIVLDDNRVVGCLSFDIYNNVGLVRYFVFKKGLAFSYIEKLFNDVINTCKEFNITKLACFQENSELRKLFIDVGFTEINKSIFIDEEKKDKTVFAKSLLLEKNIG